MVRHRILGLRNIRLNGYGNFGPKKRGTRWGSWAWHLRIWYFSITPMPLYQPVEQ
jgi:hypothetical protein